MKRVALTLVFFGVCFIAFLILYPAYDTVAIRWPKLKSPESFVADCEFLLKNYPEQSSVPADEWPTSIAEIQPRHVLVKDGYVDIVISTGGIGDSWGLIVTPKDIDAVPTYALRTENPRVFRYK